MEKFADSPPWRGWRLSGGGGILLKFNTYFNHDNDIFSSDSPSLCCQEFKEECDINRIMKLYSETGSLSHVNNSIPIFDDISHVSDLFSAYSLLDVAQSKFEMIPSEIRMQFGNDPLKFEEWIYANPDMALKLGLLNSVSSNNSATPHNLVVPKFEVIDSVDSSLPSSDTNV